MFQDRPHLTRAIGVLLHPSALPISPTFGSFGEPSREWIKALAIHGIGVWQFLPLAPPDGTGSPYSSPSSFAVNPSFLDANDLANEGFISFDVIDGLPGENETNDSSVDFRLAEKRSEKLGKLLVESWPSQNAKRHREFIHWCAGQFWLEDHASFMELRRQYQGLPWWKWPKAFAFRNPFSLYFWKIKYKQNLLGHRLIQWHLDRQWNALRKLAS